MSFLRKSVNFVRDILDILLPFGRKSFAILLISMFVVAILQLIGVASIMPFLSAAAAPEQFQASKVGALLQEVFHTSTPAQLIYLTGIICIVLLVVVNAGSFVNQLIVAKYSSSLAHWLRMTLLESYYAKPYSYFLSRNSSVLAKKVNTDVYMFTTFLVAPLCDFLTRLMTTAVLAIALFCYQPVVVLSAMLIFLGFYLGFIKVSRNRVRMINHISKETSQNLSRINQQFLLGIRDIKLRSAGGYFIDMAKSVSSRQVKATVSGALLGILPRTMVEPLAFSAIILWTMIALGTGSLEALIPTLGVMAMASYRVLPNLQALYNSLHLVASNHYVLEELKEELSTIEHRCLESTSSKSVSFEKSIEFADVSFRYDGTEALTLDGINFSIYRGQSIGLVGPTGSGKSTLINILLGIYRPTSGDVMFDSQPIPVSQNEWASRIGYVPQEIFLWDGTLKQNISFGVPAEKMDEEKIRKVIALAQLDDVVAAMPKGLETEIGERGLRLSGGQRQRIGLARALYFEPEVLILDEGTSALDNETEMKFMRALESLYGSMTIILIAHRLSTVKNCDKIFLLKNGKIAESGSYNDLMQRGTEFYRLATASHGENH
jgi:ATP-binding cassette, subfamily B, bacterial PglK